MLNSFSDVAVIKFAMYASKLQVYVLLVYKRLVPPLPVPLLWLGGQKSESETII